MSFYSPSLYRDIARNWRGVGFLYLMLLICVTLLPMVWPIQKSINQFMLSFAYPIAAQLPTITIQDGVASVDRVTPHFIKNPETGEVLAIIDMTGQYTSLEGTAAELLLTANHVVFKKERGEEISNLPKGNMQIIPDKVKLFLDQVKANAIFAILSALWGFWLVFWFFLIMLYGGIGVLFAKFNKVRLAYGALLRLATIAITPALLIELVAGLSQLYFNTQLFPSVRWLLYFFLPLAYLYFGVHVNRQEESSS